MEIRANAGGLTSTPLNHAAHVLLSVYMARCVVRLSVERAERAERKPGFAASAGLKIRMCSCTVQTCMLKTHRHQDDDLPGPRAAEEELVDESPTAAVDKIVQDCVQYLLDATCQTSHMDE